MSAVSLSLAKQYLQVAHTSQDAVIQALVDGAEDFLAQFLNVRLTSASGQEDLDGGDWVLRPGRRPVTALASVTDLWTSTVYAARLVGDGRLVRTDDAGRALGARWPDGAARFRAQYTAGFTALPAAVQEAVLQLVFRAYYQRGSEAASGESGNRAEWGALLDAPLLELVKPYARGAAARA